jgi:hypothetical protein
MRRTSKFDESKLMIKAAFTATTGARDGLSLPGVYSGRDFTCVLSMPLRLCAVNSL